MAIAPAACAGVYGVALGFVCELWKYWGGLRKASSSGSELSDPSGLVRATSSSSMECPNR